MTNGFPFHLTGKAGVLGLIIYLVLHYWPDDFTKSEGIRVLCAFGFFFPVLRCLHKQAIKKIQRTK